ncbi:hypothetical protein [Aeromonas veronii]|uniref:hypothetical protein n=1 Tax=Aeromonas veronii TaxID=654 RepID=UPI003F67A960
MKQVIILLCCALLGGCIEPAAQSGSEQTNKPQQIEPYNNDSRFGVWHDDQRSVTCWIYDGYRERSIACLPDKDLAGGK